MLSKFRGSKLHKVAGKGQGPVGFGGDTYVIKQPYAVHEVARLAHHTVLIGMGCLEGTRSGLRSRLRRKTPQSAESMPHEAPADCPPPVACNTLAHALPEGRHRR